MTTTYKLRHIIWNTLYQSKQAKRDFAEKRIRAHYIIRKLGKRKVEYAEVRDTPWHGESGKASTGGHITVDFLAPTHPEEKKRVVTHHFTSSHLSTRCAGGARYVYEIAFNSKVFSLAFCLRRHYSAANDISRRNSSTVPLGAMKHIPPMPVNVSLPRARRLFLRRLKPNSSLSMAFKFSSVPDTSTDVDGQDNPNYHLRCAYHYDGHSAYDYDYGYPYHDAPVE
ncbi:hypothetical protein V8E53_004593 [Lactarius tabidus]